MVYRSTNLSIMKNNFTKIASYALSMSYGAEKAPLLAEMCDATPNAVVAIETLLGIYEEPLINILPHKDCEKRVLDKEFVSYDKWNDRVHFKGKYNSNNNDEDAPVYRETTSYCSLRSWNEGNGW